MTTSAVKGFLCLEIYEVLFGMGDEVYQAHLKPLRTFGRV